MSNKTYFSAEEASNGNFFKANIQNERELAYVENIETTNYSRNVYLEKPTAEHEANLVTSLVRNSSGYFGYPDVLTHRPVLDLDVCHTLVESSTPGHGHLYLDIDLTWEEYAELLKALEKAGIIQTGFYDSAIRNKATAVRLPWVKKSQPEPQEINFDNLDL